MRQSQGAILAKAALVELGCDIAQGWFHGRPSPGPEILRRLDSEAALRTAAGTAAGTTAGTAAGTAASTTAGTAAPSDVGGLS